MCDFSPGQKSSWCSWKRQTPWKRWKHYTIVKAHARRYTQMISPQSRLAWNFWCWSTDRLTICVSRFYGRYVLLYISSWIHIRYSCVHPTARAAPFIWQMSYPFQWSGPGRWSRSPFSYLPQLERHKALRDPLRFTKIPLNHPDQPVCTPHTIGTKQGIYLSRNLGKPRLLANLCLPWYHQLSE